MKALNYGKIRALKLDKKEYKMTPEDFYKALKELGFDLSQKQKDQFQRYFELLVETKRSILLQSQKETRSTSNISTIP